MDNRVIIIGPAHHNTLGVIRSLGKMGLKDRIQVILRGSENCAFTRTKYVRTNNFYFCNDYVHSIEILLSLSPQHNEPKPIVICCSDSAISEVDQRYDTLSKWFILPNAKSQQGEITRLLEKNNQIFEAKRLGLNIPETLTYYKGKSIEWSQYPCIIKPLDIHVGGKSDIIICKDADELHNAIANLASSIVIIQPFIEKALEFQIIGCSLGDRIVTPGYTQIIRQPYNTNTGYLVFDSLNKLNFNVKQVADFIISLGYVGLFSVEFIRDKSGKDYFLEINMRNDGNAYCVTASGCNLPFIYYKYMADGNIPSINNKINRTYLIPDFIDLTEARRQRVPMSTWISQFLSADAHTLLDWSDMGPFCFEIRKEVRRFIRKFF